MTRTWNLTTLALTVIGMLSASHATAQQTTQKQTSDKDRQQQADDQQQIEIPAALEELNLTSEQQEQIKQAMRSHDEEIQQAWKRFNKAHERTIELEAAWVAAVRDTIAEADKQKFDQQRLQHLEEAQHADEDADSEGRATRPQERAQDRDQAQDAERSQTENADDENRDRETPADRRQARADRREAAWDQQAHRFVVITLVSPEQHAQGATQTAEQKRQCAQVCQEYKQELTTAWNKMHRLHRELVRLEADRFQAIERQLTPEQLNQLQETRQQPTEETAAVGSEVKNR